MDYNKLLEKALENYSRKIPEEVIKCAVSTGEFGIDWLNSLEDLVKEFEEKWKIKVKETLKGGSRAYVAKAVGENKESYVLKIEIPESVGNSDINNGVKTMLKANGKSYAKLIKYDLQKNVFLLEELGQTLKSKGFTIDEQIEIICKTLKKSWEIPIDNLDLPAGLECTVWFKEFLSGYLEKTADLNEVINKALLYLDIREKSFDSKEYVLIHGDAHADNILEDLNENNKYKFIDPDGAICEKATDLGVIMREWPEEYEENACENGKKRAEYIGLLTGVDSKAIWQWGYIQVLATALVLLEINRKEESDKLLKIAKAWNENT